MSRHVLDTDMLVLFQEGNPAVCQRVLSRPLFELATTVITVEEQLSGWYSLLRKVKGAQALARAYQRLADNVSVPSQFPIFSFTETAIGSDPQPAGLSKCTRFGRGGLVHLNAARSH